MILVQSGSHTQECLPGLAQASLLLSWLFVVSILVVCVFFYQRNPPYLDNVPTLTNYTRTIIDASLSVGVGVGGGGVSGMGTRRRTVCCGSAISRQGRHNNAYLGQRQ